MRVMETSVNRADPVCVDSDSVRVDGSYLSMMPFTLNVVEGGTDGGT